MVKFGLLFTAIAVGMPAGLASLVLQAQAFFTILFAALVLKEKPGPHQFLGGVVACLGLVLIGWPRLTGSEMVPFLLTVAAAIRLLGQNGGCEHRRAGGGQSDQFRTHNKKPF